MSKVYNKGKMCFVSELNVDALLLGVYWPLETKNMILAAEKYADIFSISIKIALGSG